MRKMDVRKLVYLAALSTLVAAGVLGGVVATAAAQNASSSSDHYYVNEVQFGSGGSLNSCSGAYCAKQSLGDTTVGDARSDHYSAYFGINTSAEPYIDVWTQGGLQDLGVIGPDDTAVASNLIKVRNYLSSGYVLQITGSSPSQGTHALEPIDDVSCPCTSQPGAEQFGINMALNTSPAVGAAPVHVPSSSFSFGQVADDYNTPNLFKYVNGDIVAYSERSSGETDYTLSMILNTSNLTPGGQYTGALSAVVVPIY